MEVLVALVVVVAALAGIFGAQTKQQEAEADGRWYASKEQGKPDYRAYSEGSAWGCLSAMALPFALGAVGLILWVAAGGVP